MNTYSAYTIATRQNAAKNICQNLAPYLHPVNRATLFRNIMKLSESAFRKGQLAKTGHVQERNSITWKLREKITKHVDKKCFDFRQPFLKFTDPSSDDALEILYSTLSGIRISSVRDKTIQEILYILELSYKSGTEESNNNSVMDGLLVRLKLDQ